MAALQFVMREKDPKWFMALMWFKYHIIKGFQALGWGETT